MYPELEYDGINYINIYDENATSFSGRLKLGNFGFTYQTTIVPRFKEYVPYSLIQNVLSYTREDDNLQKSNNGTSTSLRNSINSLRSNILPSEKCAEIMIQCKNFQSYLFYGEYSSIMNDITFEIQKRSNINEYSLLSCFHNKNSENDYGWSIFNIEGEYNRMCIEPRRWIKTTINEGFKLCPSYPEILYIPTGMTNNIIYNSSKFRSKQRFPVLSYYHDPSQAAICRSSQPLAGLTKKCKEDILLLQAIAKSSYNSTQLVIVDTRPKINALANKAKGKGFEDGKNYPFCKFYFSGIENIHVMRESGQKLFQAIYTNHDNYINYINAIEYSGWMKHIKAILDAAIFVSHTILSGTSVLVHCSDGWDRTSQTCALASLFLDPFYRTIHGFIILIEKDFLSFGHLFGSRCQHLSGDNKNVSPIFLQFLDCVWQVMRQFPSSFQFNEFFLLYISKNVYSCEYGTFLYNSVNDRIKNNLSKYTNSLWSIDMEPFQNPLMDWNINGRVITPQTSKDALRLWTNCYANGLNFPNIIDSHILAFNSMIELKHFQRIYPELKHVAATNWQIPSSNTQHCPCGELYSSQTHNFIYHCWKCYKIGCSKCIITNQSSNHFNICSNCANNLITHNLNDNSAIIDNNT